MPHTQLQHKMPGPVSLGGPSDPHKTVESSRDLVSVTQGPGPTQTLLPARMRLTL